MMQKVDYKTEEDKDEAREPEYERVNSASALWAREKKDITDDEYKEFYKHVSHDFQDPQSWIHNKVEGNQSYTSLFYIPAKAPFDLFDRDHKRGIKLYVKRVFIMDDAEHLMPNYLRFIKGVVDSDDLPLNVSREILQQNKVIDRIRGASVKKVLGKLESMAKDQPHEGGAEKNLLHHRGILLGGEKQPAPGSIQEKRHRSAVAERPHR